MAEAYKTKYIPNHPEKYEGNPRRIICRSNWERNVCIWCDNSSDVISWGSETVAIPYRAEFDPTSRRVRRYFVDFKIRFRSGISLLVEVKPEKQTKPPKKRNTRDNRFLKEVATWSINCSKWKAAYMFAKANGYVFQIWTEKTLERMGIIPKETWQGKRFQSSMRF